MPEFPFDRSEYRTRIQRTRQSMAAERLDGMLLFHQESLYYLFGYDQVGYWVYQAVVLPADPSVPTIAVCRRADELIIRDLPLVDEISTWLDDGDRDPGWTTAQVLEAHGLLGSSKRLGVEKKSHALVPYYYDLLRGHLDGRVELVDASDLVTELRLIKSPAEMRYMRRAGEIMDKAFAAAFEVVHAGRRECDVNAAVLSTLSTEGADYPAVAPPIAFGRRTLTQTHGAATERVIQQGDVFTIEIGAPYKRYHAVAVHSGCVGAPPAEVQTLYGHMRDGLERGLESIAPGVPTSRVCRAVNAGLEPGGLSRTGRHVGYGIGIGYPPTWIDNLRIKERDTHVLQPGMTFFLFVGAQTPAGDRCLYLGEPVAVTDRGAERLSGLPRQLRIIGAA